jgi:hypothetical protein
VSVSILRPTRRGGDRAHRSHAFDDDNYWFPYRTALCGREIEGHKLTAERLEIVELCAQCKKHLARMEEVQAA